MKYIRQFSISKKVLTKYTIGENDVKLLTIHEKSE